MTSVAAPQIQIEVPPPGVPTGSSKLTEDESAYVADLVIKETGIKYDNTNGKFTMKVNGKEEEISALEAVAMTLVERFKELSSVLGAKVVKMQQELQRINESSEWATKLGDAKNLDALPEASDELKAWMSENKIDPSKWQPDDSGELTQEQKDDIANAKKLFENRVDQLSGTNDLTALSLKNTSQKSEQAFSTANAIQGILRQLMQGMAQRL
ncbi:MAG: hypothetical protein OXJ53_13535 [Gammaproteobacteria bacterium]|nr:hypothetical protein [Gammaproteobacteria bacterium]MDE0273959.1 hypothetical protein [Gammaproteobacteria bacterium]